MLTPRLIDVLAALARLVAAVELRIASSAGPHVATGPALEVELASDVDRACADLVSNYEEAGLCRASSVPTPLAELVLHRLRDAQRHFRKVNSPDWHSESDTADILNHLLIHSWYRYA